MIKVIGIIGDTGYGKTMSFVVPPNGEIKKDEYNGMNLNDSVIINLDGKELPFKVYADIFPFWKEKFKNFFEKKVLQINPNNLTNVISKILEKKEIKNIIVDTLSMGMFRERMKDENKKGYERWTKLNIEFWNFLDNLLISKNDNNVYVWLLFHVDINKDRDGNTIYSAKMEGKQLNKIPEKLMTNVFFATKSNNKYVFETQANGTTAKNPPLLFDFMIPNSMKLIENTLRGINK